MFFMQIKPKEMKDNILDIDGIPIIRLKTIENAEKNVLRKKLVSLLN